MSLDDFCALDFVEFEAVVKAYEKGLRGDWERMRLQTTALLQPHTARGRKLTPRKIFRFPWDVEPGDSVNPPSASREDFRKRMEELADRWDKVVTV